MLFTVPLHVSSGHGRAPLHFALRRVVFRCVFLASVSATRNKTRKHKMQRVVSKRVFCLPSDIHLRNLQSLNDSGSTMTAHGSLDPI
jgi:hypothetical protein